MKLKSMSIISISTTILVGIALIFVFAILKKSKSDVVKTEPENLIMPVDTLGVTGRGVNIYVYVIDGCEYVGNMDDFQSHDLTHKGDCENPVHKVNYQTFFKK